MVFTTKMKKVGGSFIITIPPQEVEYNDYNQEEWLEVRICRAKQGESER